MPKASSNQAKVRQALVLLEQVVALLKTSHMLEERTVEQIRAPHLFEDMPAQGHIDKFIKETRQTIPEVGTHGYLVTQHATKRYTVIGAENSSHAANKATKLFGPNWTELRDVLCKIDYESKGYKFLSVKDFNQLIALLNKS